YLFYAYKKRDFNLANSYNWFVKNVNKFLSLPREKRNETYVGFCFLHGIEVLIILLFLTIFSKSFFFIFIGFSLHFLFDYFSESFSMDRIDKFSVIHDFKQLKNLKFIEDVTER
ncbi:hypothetical protein J4474_05190, partial [Candidatus Pacearchaeota archaeon]|nr:hypothetical protein [Candidatus Pacearchaeota archaeon]